MSPGLSPAEAARQRTVKLIVIGLGILIMLAMAGVIAGMVHRASRIGKGPGTLPATVSGYSNPTVNSGSAATAALRPEISLPLPAGHQIRSTTLSGSRLVVHHEGAQGGGGVSGVVPGSLEGSEARLPPAGIVILDLITGQVVSRITVSPIPIR